MKRPNYGLYGSPTFFIVGGLIAFVSLVAVFVDFYRGFAAVALVAAVAVVLSIPLIFGRARMRMVDKIVNTAAIDGNALILDVGTGRGFPAIEIAKKVPGSRVIGIDLWGERAEGQVHQGWIIGDTKAHAVRNAGLAGVSDRVEFKQCDARQMPFDANTFDAVVSFVALHQVVRFARGGEKALDEIARVLKKGGRFVDADMLIGKAMVDRLAAIGFDDVRVESARVFPVTLKMLVATK